MVGLRGFVYQIQTQRQGRTSVFSKSRPSESPRLETPREILAVDFLCPKGNDHRFNVIKVKQKITQSLLVPIIKHDAGIGRQATADEIANFMLGPPMVFLPDEPTVQGMRIEYTPFARWFAGKSCASQSQHIQSSHLVGSKRCYASGARGRLTQTPRGTLTRSSNGNGTCQVLVS